MSTANSSGCDDQRALEPAAEVFPAVQFREMRPGDIPAGLRLCRASRWNQVGRDWEQFLLLEPHGAVVAAREERIVGTVATLRYGARFGWVAMVLVDPAERGRGLGTGLLHRGLSLLTGVGAARLDATPAGEGLYAKLGFIEEQRLTRLQRPAAPLASDHSDRGVRPLSGEDWPAVLTMDERVFGADRSRMLRWLHEGAREYALVAGQSALEGFVLGRHGYHYEHIGPVVAADAQVACRLVGTCMAHHPERSFILDAPDTHAVWRAWLKEAGFVAQRPFIRMYRGPHVTLGCMAETFASIGPEFG